MKKPLLITLLLILILLGLAIGFFYPTLHEHLLNSVNQPEGKLLNPHQEENQNNYHKTIASLAKLKGRAAGSSYEKDAASILAREFVNLDLEPLPRNNNFYFQTFTIPKRRQTYLTDQRLRFRAVGAFTSPSQNVLGFLPGQNLDKIIIFTAHYDGQGINNNEIYESANDNLSGIYLLLNIAEALKDRQHRNLSYLFVAFGSEEIGLYGSQFFSKNLPVKKEHILGVLNFDTVSTESETMQLQSFSRNVMVKNTETALLDYGFTVNPQFSKLRTSDHYHFSAAGFDALTMSADDWLVGNHTPQDTYDKLNFHMMDQLVKAMVDMALTMDEAEPH